MLTRWIYRAFIVLFSLGIGFAACYCYLNMDFNKQEEEIDVHYQYTEYTVFEDEFEKNISSKGQILVSEEEEYIDEYLFDYNDDNAIEIYVNEGDKIAAGQTIATSWDNSLAQNEAAKASGKVVEVKDDTSCKTKIVKVLNYSKLYFTCNLKYSDFNKLDYDTEVYYRLKNGDKVPCRILHMGYEVQEAGYVEVWVVPKKEKEYLPGISREFFFVIDKSEKCLAIDKCAVVVQDGIASVLAKTGEEGDDGYTEKEITIGKPIEIVEDGNTFYYYEIKDGLSEGDKVYSRKATYNVAEDAEE